MHLWFVNSVVSSSELEDETTADDDDDERKKHNITKHKVHFLKACCVASSSSSSIPYSFIIMLSDATPHITIISNTTEHNILKNIKSSNQ